MVFSKPIHAPKKWVEKGKGLLDEEVDEQLEGLQEIIDTFIQCDLCDETTVRKYRGKLRPYNFTRSLNPIIPETKLGREVFKALAHFTMGIFIADDIMEKQPEEEIRKMCTTFAHLDAKSRQSFPSFPAIDDIKEVVDASSVSKNVAGPIVFLEQFLNKQASLLLSHGDFSLSDVKEFRLRGYNMMAIYFLRVLEETEIQKKPGSIEVIWRRAFGGCVPFYLLTAEIFSGAIGKLKEHYTALTELYVLGGIYVATLNDVFSYYREAHTVADNVVKAMVSQKEVETLEEAAANVAEFLDSIMQYLYEKVEELQRKDPNNRELHVCLDYVGRMTVGSVYAHLLPRYKDTTLSYYLEEVKEDQLSSWLSKKGEYGTRMLKNILEVIHQRMADGQMEALAGAFPYCGKFLGVVIPDTICCTSSIV